MVNEALRKILCYNLRCFVQSAYELGITATFWGKVTASVPAQKEEVDFIDALAWV
jgi:hypothetical protein